MKKEIVRDEKGRFVPGISGNPEGRAPDGESVTGMLCEYLNSKKTVRSQKIRKQILIDKLFAKAEKGDIQAIKLILSYTDGLPVARIQGEFTENINNNSQWVAIRTQILQVISLHPELSEELCGVLNDD